MMLVVLATILVGVGLGLLCVELADRRRHKSEGAGPPSVSENARTVWGNVDVLPRDGDA